MAFQLINVTKTFICLVFSVKVMVTNGQGVYNGVKDSTVRGCNPLVDVAFLLDRTANITSEQFLKQTEFIHDLLGSHVAPSGAVTLGYVVCENNRTTIQNFHPYMGSTLEQLRTVSQNNASSSRRERCISSLRRLFKESGRHEVVQIALMIIAHQDHWNDDHTLSEAKAMKQKGITLLVVTIGRRNFKELHSLRSIATSDDKFFVLSSFEDLKKLASDLSTGSCLPIALKPGPRDDVSIETTTLPTNTVPLNTGRCREIEGSNSYEKYIPFLGWLLMKCSKGAQIDLHDCNCKRLPKRKSDVRSSVMMPTVGNIVKDKFGHQEEIERSLTVTKINNSKDSIKEKVGLHKSDEEALTSLEIHSVRLDDNSVSYSARILSSSFSSSSETISSTDYMKSSTLHLQSSINSDPGLSSYHAKYTLMTQFSSTYHESTMVSLNTELDKPYFNSVIRKSSPSKVTSSWYIGDDLQYETASTYSDIRPTLSSNYLPDSFDVIDFLEPT